jgi:hypothetical protein
LHAARLGSLSIWMRRRRSRRRMRKGM